MWCFYVLLGFSIFWSIWNDSSCKTVVDVASKMFWWFWTFSWIIKFIPSNFCITFGFNNVRWTTIIIPFIGDTRFLIVSIFKGNKDFLFLVFHVLTSLKLLLVNSWNFIKKCFDLTSLSPQWDISMNMKDFIISNQLGGVIKLSSPHYLPFWDSLNTLFMKYNG